jgi:hypothetical protein
MLGLGGRLAYGAGMPGESPTAYVPAAVRRARVRNRNWAIFAWVIGAAFFLVWFGSLLYIARDIPPPWGWLAIAGWVAAGPVLGYTLLVILRPVERRYLSSTDRELAKEA